MKSIGDIQADIERYEKERDICIERNYNDMINILNGKIDALKWLLGSSKPCDYCKSKTDAKDLVSTKHDQVFIDPDEKKIVWEHTDFFNDIEDPFDPDEVTITVEFEAEFCPKCGARLSA